MLVLGGYQNHEQTPDGPIPGYIPVFDGYPVWSTCHLSLQVFIAQLCLLAPIFFVYLSHLGLRCLFNN
jgi:hypothetical protein